MGVPTRVPAPPSVIEPADILTPEELASRLKVKRTWLIERQRRGKPLPYFKVGRYYRYSWTRVSRWLAEQAVGS
jgi:hypothetical protein